ncbi:hypothetical protein M422DRAFT_54913 [Sphaerobolus stellatus SS14]|uniref:Uncharacterized protein n=1 Tax=Sphaerobolus stellatus (strain SS14) TaxID=990650 RepID=A0A0C9UQT2_SPHS4|nr:hypothetical protein M422DRAFT_54913 [Sphaerobolus stellatus SS14]
MAIMSLYIHKLADTFYPCLDELNELRAHIKDREIQTGKIQAEIQYYDCIIENFRREQFKDNTIRGFLQQHETALIAQHAHLEEANFATQAAHGFFVPIRRLPYGAVAEDIRALRAGAGGAKEGVLGEPWRYQGACSCRGPEL